MEMYPGSTEISNTIVGQSQISCIMVYPLCMFTQELQHWAGKLVHVACFNSELHILTKEVTHF